MAHNIQTPYLKCALSYGQDAKMAFDAVCSAHRDPRCQMALFLSGAHTRELSRQCPAYQIQLQQSKDSP